LGQLGIPDIEVAILQLYALPVCPNLAFSAYGTSIDDDLTERVISCGVDMFLGHYAPRGGKPWVTPSAALLISSSAKHRPESITR
jgi:TetR/AcrR family transcriptional regulator, mexJK operon transcriptional repressor